MNSKRELLLAMGSGLVSSGFAQSPASVSPKEKGPLVWLDMDQAELDASYAKGED
jgi:arylformamidase